MQREDKNIDKLLDYMIRMYDLYEEYIWEHNNENIKIRIQITNNLFRILWTDNEEIIDFQQYKFENTEKDLHEYISLYMTRYAFKDININKSANIYTNTIHRPYLILEVNDSKMFNIINELVEKNNNHQNNDIDNMLMSRYCKIINNNPVEDKIINIAEQRLKLSKKIIGTKK